MTQDNKQLTRDFFNRINSGDFAGAAAQLSDECINHAAIPEAQGRRGFEMILTKVKGAFPDLRYTLDDIFAEGDRVAVRVTCTGTQRGPMTFTRLQMEPTGKPVKFEQLHVLRIANGKIVEQWMCQDSLAMFRQLGLQISPSA
jgi:predicted ester cyclase